MKRLGTFLPWMPADFHPIATVSADSAGAMFFAESSLQPAKQVSALNRTPTSRLK